MTSKECKEKANAAVRRKGTKEKAEQLDQHMPSLTFSQSGTYTQQHGQHGGTQDTDSGSCPWPLNSFAKALPFD